MVQDVARVIEIAENFVVFKNTVVLEGEDGEECGEIIGWG